MLACQHQERFGQGQTKLLIFFFLSWGWSFWQFSSCWQGWRHRKGERQRRRTEDFWWQGQSTQLSPDFSSGRFFFFKRLDLRYSGKKNWQCKISIKKTSMQLQQFQFVTSLFNKRERRNMNPQVISEFLRHFANLGSKSHFLLGPVLLPMQSFNGFGRQHWMEWLGATIEFNGFFWWFWGQATIGFNGFWWLSTIGPTIEWLLTIIKV